ncbi:hypothetical protein DPMN_151082 [Dreissena polymorpha]|uniref:Uncharacterized protein n=1 Tax=Dreissena polymorpha TaxID=45954 RepID=A0A9D4FIV3_DREPO|nr:hypothetical protein DPMN_151082 [Dreissena polymorpha]
MRNHLAEEVLNRDMLNLFNEYRKSLTDGRELDGAIQFIGLTSSMIEIFKDTRPIVSIEDYRLKDLKDIYEWFVECETIQKNCKCTLSQQCMADIKSCLLGFIELCQMLLIKKSIHITPVMINSDIVENHLCQQRSTFNGANTNPTALQYRRNLNSIILSQTIVSQKANAGKSNIKFSSIAFTPLSKKPAKRESLTSIDDEEITKFKVIGM